jgi:Zn-dependent protease
LESSKVAMGFAWYIIFLFSTVLHEASHALAAKLGGDNTAEDQVTLDPIPHIRREPFGMVVIPVILFLTSGMMLGWASTPFDPFWASRNPHKAAKMALAGPLANLFLAVVGGVVLHLGLANGWFAGTGDMHTVGLLFKILFILNVVLFVLNLMPAPPLDGSSAISLLMPEEKARSWQEQMRNPQFAMITMLAIFFLFPKLVDPILDFAIRLVTG